MIARHYTNFHFAFSKRAPAQRRIHGEVMGGANAIIDTTMVRVHRIVLSFSTKDRDALPVRQHAMGMELLDWRPDLDLNQDKRPCTAPASVSAIGPLSGS